MNQKPDECSSSELDAIEVGPGTEDDLPAITEILNDAILHSDATLTSQPVAVAERRDWFGRFSSAGPYRLFVPNDASVALHRKFGFTRWARSTNTVRRTAAT